MRPSAHDPVCLPAQPGPRGPPQGALLRLLRAGPWLLARPSRVLTVPCPHSRLPLFCNITSFSHISCCGPGLSLACLCWAGYPAELPQGPLWEQGSPTRGPPLATFWGGFLSGPHRFSPGMLGRAPALPSLHLTHPHTTRPRKGCQRHAPPTPPRADHSLQINTNVQAAQSGRCQGCPSHCLRTLTSHPSLPAQGRGQASAPDTT